MMDKRILILFLAVTALGLDRVVTSLEAQPVKPPIPANNGPTTSAQLASIMTDKTGTGSITFATNPVITPIKLGAIVENQGSTTSGALTIVAPVPPATSGALTVPLSTGNTVFWFTLDKNFTLAITGCPGPVTAFTLYSIGSDSASNGTYPTSVQWPNGVPPILTPEIAKQDVMTFITRDSCATWQASITQNYGVF